MFGIAIKFLTIAVLGNVVLGAPTHEVRERDVFLGVNPNDYLGPHNTARAKTGAVALVWDNSLAASAQAWANGCQFRHSQSGQNLAAGTGSYNAAAAVQGWVNEWTAYDPRNPQPSHWTQVVWKGTTRLGCGVATCNGIFDPRYGPAQYHVCHYGPAGNVIGHFPENVSRPSSLWNNVAGASWWLLERITSNKPLAEVSRMDLIAVVDK